MMTRKRPAIRSEYRKELAEEGYKITGSYFSPLGYERFFVEKDGIKFVAIRKGGFFRWAFSSLEETLSSDQRFMEKQKAKSNPPLGK